ncbi:glycine-rich domain-containing protein [Falsirhodobacter halotolerans]|uniref:glycine-rich domain-containing protein n=1 Tax=Falsirhodobacter halotolerans TaxID=1146892 RepID=UPI001FD547E9|nr:hypothetical protein [Falsirhodobacter halotolerans]MCJ8139528.1 hypothetical protein [Falsirhodobacter halotolerans]
MFDESLGSWSTVQDGPIWYRVGVLPVSGTLRATRAGRAEVMLVGAGGTGSSSPEGGGGGAGYLLTRWLDIAPGDIAITVGSAPSASAALGGTTSAFGLIAPGGGGGNSGNGGNGSGSSGTSGSTPITIGGIGDPGNNGGRNSRGGRGARAGGGGGSTTAAGGDAATGVPGAGAQGVVVNWTGPRWVLAPGGNGAVEQASPLPRPEGFANPGAGGGAGTDPYAAQSGVVLVRYVLRQALTIGVASPATQGAAVGHAVRAAGVAGAMPTPAAAMLARAVRAVAVQAPVGTVRTSAYGLALRKASLGLSAPPVGAAVVAGIALPYIIRGRVAFAEHSRSWTSDPGRRFT